MNPFTYHRMEGNVVPSQLTHRYRYDGQLYTVAWEHDFVSAPTETRFSSALVSRASMLAVKQAEGVRVSAPVFIAELNKTSAMVATAASTIVRTYLAVKHGQFDEALRGLNLIVKKPQIVTWRREYGINPKRASANAWLQMQYGWVPLMSEVRNAVHVLGDMATSPPNRRVTFRGSARDTVRVTNPGQTLFRRESGAYEVIGTREQTFAMSARCTWTAEANQADIPAKLGLLNPAEVAWELLPLSFVADWFLPIGDYLSAFSTVSSYNSVSCVIGERCLLNEAYRPTSVYPKGASVSGFTSNTQLVSVKRYPLNAPPWSVSMSFPTSVPQALSAIALLVQKLR